MAWNWRDANCIITPLKHRHSEIRAYGESEFPVKVAAA